MAAIVRMQNTCLCVVIKCLGDDDGQRTFLSSLLRDSGSIFITKSFDLEGDNYSQ